MAIIKIMITTTEKIRNNELYYKKRLVINKCLSFETLCCTLVHYLTTSTESTTTESTERVSTTTVSTARVSTTGVSVEAVLLPQAVIIIIATNAIK